MPRLTILLNDRPYLAALVPPFTTEADALALQAQLAALAAAGALTPERIAAAVEAAWGRLWDRRGK
jgi:hypothetical protein